MNCSSCLKPLHPIEEWMASLPGEVLCVPCLRKREPSDD